MEVTKNKNTESSFSEVLKNVQFVFLWMSQTFSQFGDRIFLLFMVEMVTRNQFSNAAVSQLTLVYTFPAIIFGSVAGVFIDRWNKKTTMLLCNFLRAACVLLLLTSQSEWNIYLITFLVSTFTQFFAPAEASTIPMLVEKKNLLPANSLFMGTMFSSVVFGFALGTPIISKFSHQTTTLAIFGMYFFAGSLLFLLKTNHEPLKEKKDFFQEFKDGYNYVLGHQTVLFCVIRQIIVFSAFAALSVLVIGFVNDVLHLKPVFFGYMLAVAGLGMGGGALVAGRFGNTLGKDFLIFSGFIISSVMLVSLACTNHIAWSLGLEKKEQQKELYTSLSILYDEKKNDNLIQKIETLLLPNENGKQAVSSRTKIEALSDKQQKALSDILYLNEEKMLLLKNDERTKKTNLAKFVNNLAKEETNFITSNNKYIKVTDETLKTAKNSSAFRFFIKMQNTYIISDLLKLTKDEDNVMSAIMTLTEKNIDSLKVLRGFLRLDEDGLPLTKLGDVISEVPPQSLVYFSELLENEQEDFSLDEIQNSTLEEHINKLIKNEPSFTTLKKAKAIKTILSNPNNPIIKLILKQESSYFEIFLAFLITAIVGFGSALSAIPLQAILQEVVDEKIRGKVFGVQNMVISLSMTVPMGISGFLADFLDDKIPNMSGVSLVMIITAVFILCGGFIENAFKQKKY